MEQRHARRHRLRLEGLARDVAQDAANCRAYECLGADDRAWLESRGWQEPDHARFARLNGLSVEELEATAGRINYYSTGRP